MLLDEIIVILSSTSGSLTDALLKTKVLLHQIGRKDLVTWVNNELKGYPDDNVPDYRIVSTEVHGQLTSIAWQVTDYLLPIQHLNPETQKSLTSFAMTSSLQIIEESVRQHRERSTHGMRRNLPTEATAMFQKALQGGVNVISAWCEINMQTVENILAEVRSRLLDFVLELRDVVGKDADEGQLEEKAATVDAGKLFNTAIYGSGNTVVLGVHSTQTVTVTNTRGDIEGLIQAFAKIGVPADELDSLRIAIGQDQTAGVKPMLGESKTGNWFTKLLGRAANKGIYVGVDLLSSTAAKTIAAFNGVPL
jgi:hypothetical protein